ncbi:MAG: caspase family protein [Acidobacteriota bacterium]|nr:MAG: caspase family protein [Acidobacteriota bacterium]
MTDRFDQVVETAKIKKSLIFFVLTLLVLTAGATIANAKGNRYGVFVAIEDYKFAPLPGTAKDASMWKKTMIDYFGFSEGNTKLVLNKDATRAGILNSIAEMAKKVQPGDLFVFTYSGHGTLWFDQYSPVRDEARKISVDLWAGETEDSHIVYPLDYYDAAIVPIDADDEGSGRPWGNLILDDELFFALAPIAEKGARVVFISDSCHSGTIAKGEVKASEYKARFVDPADVLGKDALKNLKVPANQKSGRQTIKNGFYLTLSASSDTEVSWGGPDGGLFTSMVTGYIERSAQRVKEMTYSELHVITQALVVRISEEQLPTVQTPQIDLFAFDVSSEDDSWADRIYGEKIFQP